MSIVSETELPPGAVNVQEYGRPEIAVVYQKGQLNHLVTKLFKEEVGYGEIELITHEDFDPGKDDYKGVIFPGGPHSVAEKEDAGFKYQVEWEKIDCPILGICLGHQMAANEYGSKVTNNEGGEYGVNMYMQVENVGGIYSEEIFKEGNEFPVMFSHQDTVENVPDGEDWQKNTVSKWTDGSIAGLENKEEDIYTLQFHPEASQTTVGPAIAARFLEICGVEEDKYSFDSKQFLEDLEK